MKGFFFFYYASPVCQQEYRNIFREFCVFVVLILDILVVLADLCQNDTK